MSKEEADKPQTAIRPEPMDDGGVIAVESLLSVRREVVPVHQGERYVLRITAKGKLILTK